MKFDTGVLAPSLAAVPALARQAEAIGFDGLWTSETQHNAFLPLVLAAEHTGRIELGTAIAVAFARNPMDVAYTAWDLAQFSHGRFILGLGTQVKPHIERRFSMPWGPAAPKLREFIQAVRHIWDVWQHGARLNFRGEFYKHTLMSPFFNPGPIEYSRIPIYIAGVNEQLCQLAGELADGFHVHPYHSPSYLRERVIPWIEAGAAAAGRERAAVVLTTTVFVITGRDEVALERSRAAVRQQIAFYASTPTYQSVMAHHGWLETAERLSGLAARQKWAEMPALVTDEMLATFAVEAPPDRLAATVEARYAGLIDRLAYYAEFIPDADEEFWRMTVAHFHSKQ
ncbi:MAG: TIGR03617 family F420-dependent LLM class oxidoreductase [Ardenticatenaceae bacterium]|nr:TIGR03617 family F420-dependent LLM class oxidoreductase [Ardenticatenaceae bacterium]